MKATQGKARVQRDQAAPPSDLVEWDLLQHTHGMSAEQLRSTANVFRRWADQCERQAVVKSNDVPPEARN